MLGYRVAVLLAGALLASCSAITSLPPVRSYRLDYPPPAPVAAPLPATLRVLPFSIAAPYDRQAFVYRDGLYDIAADSYNRWFAPPAIMITDLIARDLAASRRFAAVLQAPSSLPATYELTGTIENFEEGPEGGCTAHVRLRALLVRVPERGPRAVVFDDLLAADAPCTADDPESFAAAASRAVQEVSEQLQQRLSDAVATSGPPR